MFLDILKQKSYHPLVLLILDGWGLAPAWGGNAISIAKTPNFDALWTKYQHTELCASGVCVGLPGHEVGNSEVGHLNLGAGRKLALDVTHINQSISDKTFFHNEVLINAIHYAEGKNSKIHLVGLFSDGGVHSHINHLFALLELVKQMNARNVYLHLILDGRDTPQYQALIFLEKLNNKIIELNLEQQVKIATVSGRFYAMDRDKRWERIKTYYDCITKGQAKNFKTAGEAIAFYYRNGLYDEVILPSVINKEGLVEANDSVIFYNFRSDRAVELSQSLVSNNFSGFTRIKIPNLMLVNFVPYFEHGLNIPAYFPFKSQPLSKTLSEVIADHGYKQLHLAETEKYAHVTYFFNGGANKRFVGEDDILVPSPHVDNFDQKPEMSLYTIVDTLVKNIKLQKYQFAVVNFANCDMVGHTGNFDKVVEAIGHVDKGLDIVSKTLAKYNGTLLVTADHGNAEEMIKPQTGAVNPEHTNNPVPFIFADFKKEQRNLIFNPNQNLNNVAPLILDLFNLEKPNVMDAQSLISFS